MQGHDHWRGGGCEEDEEKRDDHQESARPHKGGEGHTLLIRYSMDCGT